MTPVWGESWLTHLNRSFGETSMGKTGHLGPPPPEPVDMLSSPESELPPKIGSRGSTLHGSDIYRWNCQGCHGESGQGAPPEINPVIDPVRSTSVDLVMAKLKALGMSISRPDATKLAQGASKALLERLHHGGDEMPAFPHLNEAEVRSLLAYLKQLAGVPLAEHEQVAVSESPVRVGEHIVKSTCHTCHSATGPDPDAQQLWDGAIPPLSVLTTRKSQPEFIQKVTHGAPVLMGPQPMLHRGRMPVFYYLSDDEAADVYLYLTRYPPRDSADSNPTIALSQQDPGGGAGGGTRPPQNAGSGSFIPETAPEVHLAGHGTDSRTIILLSGIGLFVVTLLVGGLGFTILEFRRLAAEKSIQRATLKPASLAMTKKLRATLQRV